MTVSARPAVAAVSTCPQTLHGSPPSYCGAGVAGGGGAAAGVRAAARQARPHARGALHALRHAPWRRNAAAPAPRAGV
jgi:hypothetical protein